MEIVPLNEQVVVDVQVAPTDIDSVALGQKAEVRFSGLNIRSTPATYGNVVSISGDSLVDPNSRNTYFLVRVELPPDELKKLENVGLFCWYASRGFDTNWRKDSAAISFTAHN